VTGRASSTSKLTLFAVCWSLAHWFHLMEDTELREYLGNRPEASHLMVSLAIGWVLLRPAQHQRLVLLAAAGVWTVWNEAPYVSNHWLLVGLVDLAIVGSFAWARLSKGRREFGELVVPAAQWTLLCAYGWAGFSKLNADFMDPVVSCAPAFMERSFTSVGLPSGLGTSTASSWIAIVATTVIELAIPVLLIVRRTRAWGVLLGIAFHSFLALDLEHHFSDFTSVLVALFLLFMPEEFARRTIDRASELSGRVPGPVAAWLFSGFVVLAELLVISRDTTRPVAWLSWHVAAVAALAAVVTYLRSDRATDHPDFALVRPAGLLVVVPLIAFANGLTPYFELKTSGAWNMYSNLRTSAGESNHLIIRRTWPLSDQNRDAYRIVSSDNGQLRWASENDYAVTPLQLRMILSDDPDAALTYERDGVEVSLERASDDPTLVATVPRWLEKLQSYAPVDLQDSERCRW
jgi:hypothetical protein